MIKKRQNGTPYIHEVYRPRRGQYYLLDDLGYETKNTLDQLRDLVYRIIVLDGCVSCKYASSRGEVSAFITKNNTIVVNTILYAYKD